MKATVPSMIDRNNEARLEGVAARLRANNVFPDLDISVERRLHGVFVLAGLAVTGWSVDVFEPVQRRWLWSRRWHLLQSVSEAEHGVQSFLLKRPDLQS